MDSAALLIQGPIVSRGRTGADPFDKSIVEMHTVDNVQTMVREARDAGFGPIVLSTWAAEPKLADADRLQGLDRTAALAEPPTEAARAYQKYADNRSRQAAGCREGRRILRSIAETPFCARLRTDQSADMRELIAAVRQSEPGQLRVNGVRRGRWAQLQDFIVCGTTADVAAHFDALAACNYFPFHNDAHYDFFFKDAYGQLGGQIEAGAFVPNTYYLLDVQVPLFRHMFGVRYRPLPIKIARSLIWRTRPFSEEYLRTRMIMQEEWEESGRAEALQSVSRPALKLTRFNRPHFVNVQRLIDLGLETSPPPGAVHAQLARAVAGLRARLRSQSMWS